MSSLVFNKEPSGNEIKSFHDSLDNYNAMHIDNNFHKIAITVSDEKDIVVAGIDGRSYWGRAHIEHLWVAKTFRNKGVGSKLLLAFENQAKTNDCKGVQLSTMSFQAARFYEKNGYTKFAVLGGFANESSSIFYSKNI